MTQRTEGSGAWAAKGGLVLLTALLVLVLLVTGYIAWGFFSSYGESRGNRSAALANIRSQARLGGDRLAREADDGRLGRIEVAETLSEVGEFDLLSWARESTTVTVVAHVSQTYPDGWSTGDVGRCFRISIEEVGAPSPVRTVTRLPECPKPR